MKLLLVILIGAMLLVAVMINLTAKGAFRRYFMGIGGVIAIAVGLFSYSYAYTLHSGFSVSVILRVVLTVCRMFAGINDYSSISGTPLFQHEIMRVIFWMGHFLAFYITASAAIEILGHSLMRYIRAQLLRRGELCVIYGETVSAIELARQQHKNQSVALIVEQENEALKNIAEDIGCALFSGGIALCGSPEFLKTVGYDGKNRTLNLYCVSENAAQNMRCADMVCKALETQDADPGCTRLFLLGIPEYRAERLIAHSGRYGFGSVFACEQYDLIARLLIQKAPPWQFLNYDNLGRATSDFRVCIIGFGSMGRAVLRQLIINGQMEGSTFHAEVFEHRLSDMQGYMKACFPELLKHYDISLNSGNAETLYQKLSDHTPCMIVLCAGSYKANADIVSELNQFYLNRIHKPVMVQCSMNTLTIDECNYRAENIDLHDIDRQAMILNHIYCQGPSPEADWQNCPPFSRASSRASADFYPAFLQAAGISQASALEGQWPPQKEILENLAKTEHLRWCAFHLSMGYRPMSREEFERRTARYLQGEKIRLGKNDSVMTHACLIPWDELDALSDRENAITGGSVNYKAMDINNVLALQQIIQNDRNAK